MALDSRRSVMQNRNYDTNFEEPYRETVVALILFNDVIGWLAFRNRLPWWTGA